MEIKNRHIFEKDYGEFCPDCCSDNIKRRNGSFFCANCKKSLKRLLIVDKKINSWVDRDNNYWHESVGLLIQNKKGEILLIKLNKFPFGYSIPAGHVGSREKPENAAKREALEEVGMNLDDFVLVKREDLTNDSCRRGADHHRWHLFKAVVNNENVKINYESSGFVWVKPDKALTLKLTLPARHFLSGLS